MESKGSADACRQKLAQQLRERADVIAQDIVERNRALVEERNEETGGDPDEIEGVVQAVLEHGFRAIEGHEERQPPPEVATHARGLAWKSVRTHIVLRRYDAGAAIFREHLRQAGSSVKPYSEAGYADAERAIERAFNQLKDRVESEHTQEEQWLKSSPEIRKLERVRQVLSGELIYPPEDLGYDFTATHIGVVGSGPGVDDEIRRLAQVLGGQPLIVHASPNQFWAWVGLKRPRSAAQLDDVLEAKRTDTVWIAIGEPMAGLNGWRRTHRQANAVFANTSPMRPLVRYADLAVLASLAGDDLARAFLKEAYLDPLTTYGNGGQKLFDTLRAYFRAERNISSAAAALGVKRHTVSRHLEIVEQRLARSMGSCAVELELALRLHTLE